MAIPLESAIMDKIGLGMHYNWYNGSDCRSTRDAACKNLAWQITLFWFTGEKIAPPNTELINLLPKISNTEERHMLTKTWEAASYIIQTHIHAAHNPETSQDIFNEMYNYLAKTYLPKPSYEYGIYYSGNIHARGVYPPKERTKKRGWF